MKKFFRVIGYILVLLIFFIAILAGITQTAIFREGLRQYALTQTEKHINGQVLIEDIKGNLITGFKLSNVEWWFEEERHIYVETLNVRFNPLQLFSRQILIENIVLINPAVNLVRDDEGKLNLSQLIKKPAEKVTTEITLKDNGRKSPLIGTFKIANFEILNGSFSYKELNESSGSTAQKIIDFPFMNYRNVTIGNIYLTMSGSYDGDAYHVNLRSLSFSVVDPDFSVSHISLDGYISSGGVEINHLRVLTDRSNINISIQADELNLFSGFDRDGVVNKSFNLSLYAARVGFDDLKMFIPALWFFEGTASLSAEVHGTLNKISVDEINFLSGETNFNLSGTVYNAIYPDELTIDAHVYKGVILGSDVKNILPYFSIPDYSHLGPLTIDARYSGKPKNFFASVDVQSIAGHYASEVSLDLRGDRIAYNGEILTKDANISLLQEIPSLPTELFAEFRIDGSGTRLDELQTSVNMNIEKMSIQDINVHAVTGTVLAQSSDITVNIGGNVESGTFVVNGTTDLMDIDTAPFSIDLSVGSLNLAEILKDTTYESDLSFSINSQGQGFIPRKMLGKLSVKLEPSTFREYTFVGEPILVSLRQLDEENQEFRVESEIVDIYIAGTFDLPTFVSVTGSHVKEVAESIRRDIHSIQTGEIVDRLSDKLPEGVSEIVDAVYDVRVKNIEPISIFLGGDEFEIDAVGVAFGYFRSVDHQLFVGGDFDIAHLLYISDNFRLLLDDVNGWYNVENNYLKEGVEAVTANLSINADGLYTPTVHANAVSVFTDIKGGDWEFKTESVIDTNIAVTVIGSAHIAPMEVNTSLSHLRIGYKDLEFENSGTLELRYNTEGIWVDRFTLYHNKQSTLSISGLLAREGEHELYVSVEDFGLENIHSLLVTDQRERQADRLQGIISISGSVKGTQDNPSGLIEVNISDISYGRVLFGDLHGSIGYDDRYLSFEMDIANRAEEAQPALLFSGTMPFNPFPKEGELRLPDGPVSMRIFSDGLDISIMDPFIPDLYNIRGVLTSNIVMSGTLDDPIYSGVIEVTDGQFTFAQNNVTYLFNGKIEPRQDELLLSILQIQNRRRDIADGTLNITGSIQMRGFSVKEFDLLADGQLMVLNYDSRRPDHMLYGHLTVATGGNGITFRGQPDQSVLRGVLLIRSANITFPPVRTTAYDHTGTIINYIAVPDPDDEEKELTPLEIFLRGLEAERMIDDKQTQTSAFLDGLDYDIIIQTDGRVEMTMIFNQTTREELVAHLETTSLRLYKDELTGLRLIGNVDIREPSAFSFYRRFDASGRLSFVGPPDDPELDITARYTGQRVPITQVGVEGVPQDVVVNLRITGSRYQPQLAIQMTVDGEEYVGDVETDAVSFILTGRFQGELSPGDYNRISTDFGRSFPAVFMSGVATSLLSNVFTDFLRNEVRFIRTAEIVWYGGNILETAELRVSGELRHLYWTVGGRVFNDINNTNFSFQIPMGPAFNSERWTNLFLELERRSHRLEYSEDMRPVNTARLFYSISF